MKGPDPGTQSPKMCSVSQIMARCLVLQRIRRVSFVSRKISLVVKIQFGNDHVLFTLQSRDKYHGQKQLGGEKGQLRLSTHSSQTELRVGT